MKFINVHLVSDATGETLSSLIKAAFVQFESLNVNFNCWFMIRNQTQLNNAITKIGEQPGLVFYTLVNVALRAKLEDACNQLEFPVVSVLDPVFNVISHYTGQEISHQPGRQYVLDSAYFTRIEAINYAMIHDDGQVTKDLYNADIILFGVSRTSKTPTSIYLANRGYKTANVPFVMSVPIADIFTALKKPLIIGLTTSAAHLVQLRKNRIKNSYQNALRYYIDINNVNEELKAANRLFKQMNWPIIDVSRKSVEETAATIINYLNKRNNNEN